jgi:hypothetical protein
VDDGILYQVDRVIGVEIFWRNREIECQILLAFSLSSF